MPSFDEPPSLFAAAALRDNQLCESRIALAVGNGRNTSMAVLTNFSRWSAAAH
jgi:hypothetical protein